MFKSSSNTRLNAVQQQAATWVTRLHSDDCTDADCCAFDEWLAQSEEHRVAYRQVENFWQGLSQIESHAHDELEAARAYLRKHRKTQHRFSAKRGTVALSILMLLLSSPFVWTAFSTQHYQTAKGEHAIVQLSDGSQIALNTDTELTVQARSVKLLRGAAMFSVIHDVQKPFRANNPRY